MSKTRYYDREGAPIDLARWKELQADVTYCEMQVYDNGELKLILRWLGKVVSPDMMDSEYWPLYCIDVLNRDRDGKWAHSLDSQETYGQLEEAKADYQEFLLKWTDSKMEDDGKGGTAFVVADDNLFELPPEPDRNTPESAIQIGDDGVDVW